MFNIVRCIYKYSIYVTILCVIILGSDDYLPNEESSLNSVKNTLSEVYKLINIPLKYHIETETSNHDESGKYLKVIFIIYNVHNVKILYMYLWKMYFHSINTINALHYVFLLHTYYLLEIIILKLNNVVMIVLYFWNTKFAPPLSYLFLLKIKKKCTYVRCVYLK